MHSSDLEKEALGVWREWRPCGQINSCGVWDGWRKLWPVWCHLLSPHGKRPAGVEAGVLSHVSIKTKKIISADHHLKPNFHTLSITLMSTDQFQHLVLFRRTHLSVRRGGSHVFPAGRLHQPAVCIVFCSSSDQTVVKCWICLTFLFFPPLTAAAW